MVASNQPRSLCLFGAAPETGNLGVSALSCATMHGLAQRLPGAQFTVFDYGRGARADRLRMDGAEVPFIRRGATASRRWYRPEALRHMRFAARFGGLYNGSSRAICRADAVLDISGGDSFTDLYGPRRLEAVTLSKLIAIERGVPLILLPQTYGPFRSDSARGLAAKIVRGATMAWARDERSFDLLRDLLGDAFDPARHRLGVDVAFALPSHRPDRFPAALAAWLEDDATPVVGVNVSGLIYHDPDRARGHFRFQADYGAAVRRLVQTLAEDDARVMLVPHVLTPAGHYESDHGACRAVHERLPRSLRRRVVVVPPEYDCTGMKWIIGNCDWFCGTRLHSTIAALSSGVPTSAIAYSIKTRGVFATCGQAQRVADPQRLDTDELVEWLLRDWHQRREAKRTLHAHLDDVRQRGRDQMDEIAARVQALHAPVEQAAV